MTDSQFEVTKQKQVALKVMLPKIAADKKAIARFNREVAITKALKHSHIVKLYDWGCSMGTFFFTLVTYKRRRLFSSPLARQLLRDAIRHCRHHRPFDIEAIVLLPDHMHAILTLPAGDTNYSLRWNHIKRRFTMQ